MRVSEICRYCGGVIRLVPAEKVYQAATERLKQQRQWIYQCQNCNARVGCHRDSKRPLGNVANEVLRLKRVREGDLLLDRSLKPGQWRSLTEEELLLLTGPLSG